MSLRSSPLDLERCFGISGGNIFHGEMSLDQLFVLHPVAGGAPAAREILKSSPARQLA